MGQYYRIINLDKQQYLDTRSFCEGAKLMEIACSSQGSLAGLAILLADGNGRGSGDLHSENPLIGSWAGDRIVVAGDYADAGKFLSDDQIIRYQMLYDKEQPTLYEYSVKKYQDISEDVLKALLDDPFIYETYQKEELYGIAKQIFQQVKQQKEQADPMLAKVG